MTKPLFYTLALLLLAGCAERNAGETQHRQAEGYFVRNDQSDGDFSGIISSSDEFEAMFGSAATMNSVPTAIDFSHEDAAVVVLPSTDLETTILLDSVVAKDGIPVLYYSVRRGPMQSYTIRPASVTILERNYQSAPRLVVNDPDKPSGDRRIMLDFFDGKATATITKAERESVILTFEVDGIKNLKGTITSTDPAANIRFAQIFMPDGAADGPFGRDIDYYLRQAGTYRLRLGENMMAGDPWGGTFTVELNIQ